MIRALSPVLILLALASGPAFSAGGGEAEDDAAVDESMLPHAATLPGSYVALPEAFVTKVRNKLLEARGEKVEDDHSGGGH